jgi:hypothetical protein
MDGEIEAIVAGLNRDMADLLCQCQPDWFRAADLGWSRPGPTGNALNRLRARGLLEQASDETKWGRSEYRLSSRGLRVRQYLEEQGSSVSSPSHTGD